jgi:hypothetical protein
MIETQYFLVSYDDHNISGKEHYEGLYAILLYNLLPYTPY